MKAKNNGNRRWPRRGLCVLAALMLGSGGVMAQDRPAIAKLTPDDYFQIYQLYVDYSVAHDTANGPMRVATWTPDGTLDEHFFRKDTKAWSNIRAPEKMDSVLRRTNAFPPSKLPAGDMIIQTNIRVIPTADGAKATCYAYIFRDKRDDAANLASDVAYYTDTLVKTPAGWRFKTRTIYTW